MSGVRRPRWRRGQLAAALLEDFLVHGAWRTVEQVAELDGGHSAPHTAQLLAKPLAGVDTVDYNAGTGQSPLPTFAPSRHALALAVLRERSCVEDLEANSRLARTRLQRIIDRKVQRGAPREVQALVGVRRAIDGEVEP